MELWHERNAVIFLKKVNEFSPFELEDGYFVNKITQPRSQRLLSRKLVAVNRKVTGLEPGGLANAAVESIKKG